MPSRVLAFAALLIFLGVGVAAISAQDTQTMRAAGDATTIEDESWQPDPPNVTELAQSNLPNSVYADSVTVEQNGTTYAEDGNYSWIDDNGTIQTLSGTGLNTSETANITYTYYNASGELAVVRDVNAIPINLGGPLMITLAFGFIILVLGAFLRGMM